MENPELVSRFGVESSKIRDAVEFITGRGDRPTIGDIGFTPRAKKVMELAIEEAQRLRDQSLETDHIMFGLVKEGESIAAGVLESIGINFNKVRVEVALHKMHPQLHPEKRKPDSLDRLRAYLSDPHQDLIKQALLQGTLDNLANLILPPSEQQ